MLTLSIPAISCGHCARAITDTILELDPAATVQVDIGAKTAVIGLPAPTTPRCANGWPRKVTRPPHKAHAPTRL